MILTKENMKDLAINIIKDGYGYVKTYDFLYKIRDLNINEIIDFIKDQPKEKRIEMQKILRIVLTGKDRTPPNNQIMDIIGQEETISRIQQAMDLIDEKYDLKQLYEC